MIPKTERLTKKDFNGLKPRVVFRGTYLDMAVQKSPETKFACVISKKRIKKAVERNKARRKIYSNLNNNRPKNPLTIIFYPKQTAVRGQSMKIKEEISKAFDTLH